MRMTIVRPETPRDYPAIYRLVTAAFTTTLHAEGDGQDFVEQQRQSDAMSAIYCWLWRKTASSSHILR